MSRTEKRIVAGLVLLILVLAIMEARVPRPTDWGTSYSRDHMKPFGAKLLYERFTDLFPAVTTDRTGWSGPSVHKESGHLPPCRAFVNDRLHFEPDAAERLLQHVHEGEHVLLAAHVFGGLLADSLRIGTDGPRSLWAMRDTGDVRFVGDPRMLDGVFRLVRGSAGSAFTRFDTLHSRILAVNGRSEPVLIETAFGEGRFVLCSIPLVLTNFNLLKNDNHRLAAAVLSTLPSRPLVWDEFYKTGRMEARTPVRYLLSQPPLRWAWFLSLLLVVLFILVHARREQRAIPIVLPPANTTRELAHTIGRMHWHQGDHAALARSMIVSFKDEVRQRTFLRAFEHDDATTHHLAAKTGLSIDEVARRMAHWRAMESATHLSDIQLLQLSNDLHDFRQLIR
jgi:hypothetical protein